MLYDSWSKWEWDERLGPLVGMTFDRGNLLFAMLRYGKDRSNVDKWYISLERFVMDTEISDRPYMDSIRTLNYYNNTPSNNSFLNPNSDLENINVAFDRTVRQEFLGQPLENLDNLPERTQELLTSVNRNTGVPLFLTELKEALAVSERIYSLQRKIIDNNKVDKEYVEQNKKVLKASLEDKPLLSDGERDTKLKKLKERLNKKLSNYTDAEIVN